MPLDSDARRETRTDTERERKGPGEEQKDSIDNQTGVRQKARVASFERTRGKGERRSTNEEGKKNEIK